MFFLKHKLEQRHVGYVWKRRKPRCWSERSGANRLLSKKTPCGAVESYLLYPGFSAWKADAEI